jgi:hypothetical protein
MRFGIDVAQQRMEWDELVARARLGEELGFDGAWGFPRPSVGQPQTRWPNPASRHSSADRRTSSHGDRRRDAAKVLHRLGASR